LQQAVVQQRIQQLPSDFDGVLQTQQRTFYDAMRLGAGLAKLNISAAKLRGAQEPLRQVDVTQVLELRYRGN
jgi:hypothetical protein